MNFFRPACLCLTGLLGLSLSLTSAADSLASEVEAIYDAKLKDLFLHFHRNPELSTMEHQTSARLATELESLGYAVHTGVGGTGIVALLENGEGPLVMFRADMDGLPVEEKSGLSYASRAKQVDPNGNEVFVMHACGHDGHTAMLLGAAKYLAETRNFDGTVVVIFQPAEEGGGGGREMCEDGMMDRWNIQEVYGMHNWPGRPVGSFAIRPGAFFAATDQFDITFEGRGGHAAKPQETIDTTVMAAQAVTALQTPILYSLCTRH